MRQFHQTFFEESLEGLANMETELLHLEKAAANNGHETIVADPEILNTIFRAAHSIKGGSSTFGFEDVVAFAHVLESRLDSMRDGHLHPTRKVISLLLLSVDCLRSLIISARTGKEGDINAIENVRQQLERLESEQPFSPPLTVPVLKPPQGTISHWQITFRPHLHLFHTGNDPLRILRELDNLGEYRVQLDISSLPGWDQIKPEECYMGWKIELIGPILRETVNEIFSWVVDDCSLEINRKPMQSLAPRSIAEAVASMDAQAGTLRVSVPKVDALINTVGELVITQTMLSMIASNFSFDNLSRLFAGITQLERNTRELQESVMSIRMLPLSFAFNRLLRMAHDMSQRLGKKVELVFQGEQTEIDKTIIDRLIDPLMHLARNSLDHGIELPAERLAAGKSETGRIELKAYQRGGNVVIEVRDDGRGLSHERIFAKAVERGIVSSSSILSLEEIAELIFLPGFSTAESVSDLSGRGVGMDVVRNNIRSLGGSVEVASRAGQGTCFTVRLPLTLAILDGLSVEVGEQTYILPLVSIVESVRIRPEQVSRPAGSFEMYGLRMEYMPLIRLNQLFHIESRSSDLSQGLLVIVEAEGKKTGLYVDDLLGQQQVVIKNLATHYRKVEGISAATILADGTVAMILDVPGLIRLAHAGTGHVTPLVGDPPATTTTPILN